MSAEVIDLHDLRAARHEQTDTRTEMERLLAEARAEGYREGLLEGSGTGFMRGMQAAMESMRVDVPPMLDDRRKLRGVPLCGQAS